MGVATVGVPGSSRPAGVSPGGQTGGPPVPGVEGPAERAGRSLLLARAAQAFQVAVFVAWSYPGLYDLAVHVLHVQGQLGLPGGWRLERAHLYPLGVDGGIVTAFILLLSDRGQLAGGHRRELWLGMWACAGLSALGLVVDAVKAGAGLAAPLVVIPVALGTWFLHMVVERRRPAADETAAAEETAGGAVSPAVETPPVLTVAPAPPDETDETPDATPRPEPVRRAAQPAAATRRRAVSRPVSRDSALVPCDCGCDRELSRAQVYRHRKAANSS